MDNSSNMTVNTTPMANQINPEHLYGLDKNKACINNSSPSNTADIGYYIPAIDEIMRHNPCAPSVAHNDMTEKVQKSNSGKTGTAAGEEHTFLRSTENFAKRGWYFCGF